MRPGLARFGARDWTGLLNLAAVTEAVLLLVFGAAFTDLETIAFGVAVSASTALLLYRPSRLALLVRFLVFADVAFWMGTAVVNNYAQHSGDIAGPMALAVVACLGLIASLAVLFRAATMGGRAPAAVAVLALVGLALVELTFSLSKGQPSVSPSDPLAAAVNIKNAKYSNIDIRLRASPRGDYALAISNSDVFWHTFTSADLGVDERLATGSRRRVRIHAQRGVYHFYCAIPGHAQIGMKGTITVE